MALSRRVRAACAVIAAATLLAVGGASAALAAPPYETNANIDTLEFSQSETRTGWQAELQGTWSLPDNPTPPAGFSLPLPEDLQGLADEFPLVDPDGVEMGQCTVTETELYCDFDASYLAEHPLNLHGSFSFWVTVETEVEQREQRTFRFDELEAEIFVEPQPEPCPDCQYEQNNNKWGWFDRETDTIYWNVDVEAEPGGMPAGLDVTITDYPDANQTIIPERTVLLGANEFDANGAPQNWHEVGIEEVTADGSQITFTSEAGYYYRGRFVTRANDGGYAQNYGNRAEVTIEGRELVEVETETQSFDGRGDGSGESVGAFAITKDVTGDIEPIEGLRFTGTYTATLPDDTVASGSFEVEEDGTWTSPNFVTGTVVHLEEVTPVDPDNIDWGTPEFSTNDFTVGGGETVAVTLNNPASLAVGGFDIRKQIEGPQDLVPDDAEFVVEYSYPAGPGFAGGDGSVTLPADGTVVSERDLPVGAQLTLAEVTPEDLEQGSWGEAEISPSELTIGRDQIVEIVVTNTVIAESPSPTPTPSETHTPSPSPSETRTPSPSPSETRTPSPSPSETRTPSPSPSETRTPSPSPSETRTPSPSPSETSTPSPSPSETSTASPSPSETSTPSPSPSETSTPSPTESQVPPPAPSDSPSPSPQPDDDLHPTGADGIGWIVPGALAMMLLGSLIVVTQRRRQV